ncbi:type IX secretion system outer membrane channel protein PorV [Pedobacter sp. JY14-1]|uniref:type IX secretion system outer membrane channel protein PorV n=1 Tax=Pedobacter sp. JY14-1 TaxID=3034151 RepID=UPI0023E14241|nr:type IX secretion system outer membrane channel protein PorV [Pedobacter sp. JY14-1]
MNPKPILKLIAALFLLTVPLARTSAQTVGQGTQTNGSGPNNIVTAVPFLLITPDARTAGMGDAGVATQPDANSASNNPAKLAFLGQSYGFSASYSPWLKNLVPDISLTYLSGFFKTSENSTLASSLRFFSLGEIQYVDINQQDLGIYSPNELALDITYAKRFGDSFSLGTALRYIYSNLFSGQFAAAQETHAASAVAADISAYYKKPAVIFGTDAVVSAGINLSNIGTKVNYVSSGGSSNFLPGNLRLGGATTFLVDDFSQFTFALDLSKLLVPTQPLYDSQGRIIAGKDPNRSVPAGILGSFSDAPGGFGEELREINISTGIEYWYNQQFAFRAGYFYETPSKGNRRYFTAGAGLKYNIFNIDFSYLMANAQKSALANTLRFTLLFNFGDTK